METKSRSYSEIFHSVYEIARRNSEIGIKINQIFENKNKQTTNKITVMEKEILNLVEILKDVPSGTEFYSTVYGDCAFARIDNARGDYPILISAVNRCNDNHEEFLTSDGRNYVDFDGECVLFPSKENRSWEGWKYNPLKEGDPVMVSNSDGYGWQLAYYCGGNSASFYKGVDPIERDLIVPIKDFDFENIESNIHKSVV